MHENVNSSLNTQRADEYANSGDDHLASIYSTGTVAKFSEILDPEGNPITRAQMRENVNSSRHIEDTDGSTTSSISQPSFSPLSSSEASIPDPEVVDRDGRTVTRLEMRHNVNSSQVTKDAKDLAISHTSPSAFGTLRLLEESSLTCKVLTTREQSSGFRCITM